MKSNPDPLYTHKLVSGLFMAIPQYIDKFGGNMFLVFMSVHYHSMKQMRKLFQDMGLSDGGIGLQHAMGITIVPQQHRL